MIDHKDPCTGDPCTCGARIEAEETLKDILGTEAVTLAGTFGAPVITTFTVELQCGKCGWASQQMLTYGAMATTDCDCTQSDSVRILGIQNG